MEKKVFEELEYVVNRTGKPVLLALARNDVGVGQLIHDIYGDVVRNGSIEELRDAILELLEGEDQSCWERAVEWLQHANKRRVAVERIDDIRCEIKGLVAEAVEIIKEAGDGAAFERAHRCWNAHILGALDNDNEWLGGSMHTMQDTIDELAAPPDFDPDGNW